MVFAPYELGSFAEGPYIIDIPISELLPYGTEYLQYLAGNPDDRVAGRYVRSARDEKAEITVLATENAGHYQVTGTAFWGTNREWGPNVGELDFTSKLNGDTIIFEDGDSGRGYSVLIEFKDGMAEVVEKNWLGVHGMNVTFNGSYKRIPLIS